MLEILRLLQNSREAILQQGYSPVEATISKRGVALLVRARGFGPLEIWVLTTDNPGMPQCVRVGMDLDEAKAEFQKIQQTLN